MPTVLTPPPLKPRKAIEFYEQYLLSARKQGDRLAEGGALNNLGLTYVKLGNIPKAIELYDQRILIARKLGDHLGEANSLANQGLAYEILGDKQQAILLTTQALAIFEAIESSFAQKTRAKLTVLRSTSPYHILISWMTRVHAKFIAKLTAFLATSP